MSSLQSEERNILRLIQRSPDNADGWKNVSKLLWPLLNLIRDDLVEKELLADGCGRCRLTERGKIVLEYM